MEKRGLSNLVATVLIVLLALAAVALVWSFLQPSFEEAGTKIDLGTECLAINVEPVSCTYSEDGSAEVTMQYSNGEPTKLIAVVEFDEDGVITTGADPVDEGLAELTTVSTTVTGTGKPQNLKVAAVVSDGVNEETCPVSATVIACTEVTGE